MAEGGLGSPEEELLERRQQLLTAERANLDPAAVGLRHDRVVLERGVRRLEAVVELVALPEVVVDARLGGLAVLRVHLPPDGPQRTGPAFDPAAAAPRAPPLV